MRLFIFCATLLAPLPALAQSCSDFFFMLERVRAQAGQCARSPLSQAYFTKTPCDNDAPMPPQAKSYAKELETFIYNCGSYVGEYHLSASSAAQVGRLNFFPAPGDGMGLWCKGWQSTPMQLRAAPRPDAPLLGVILTGDDFDNTSDYHEGWVFLNNEDIMGWTELPPNLGLCEESAG